MGRGADHVPWLELQPVAHTDVSKTWFTGLSFLFPVPHLDCVAVTGAFEHRDESLTGVSYSEGMATGRRKLDSAALGLSVQRRLWRALVGQAGATTSYERTTTEGSMLRIGRTELEASRRELVGDGFSCGLTHAWRTFDFAGSLTLPFRTDQPFGTIDVYIQF